jgi:hypothetical protein
MSISDSMSDEKRYDDAELEKDPPPLVEEVMGTTDSPLTRAMTTPPAPLTELNKGLIAWDSPSDPQNPLLVIQIDIAFGVDMLT